MAKRDSSGKQTTATSTATTTDAIEQRVVAFAEQLGRIAGTVQAKAEGWMDRDALKAQIASVRDGAADLLEQLADGAMKTSKDAIKAASMASGEAKRKARAFVDAPGKKHRKPMPTDPRAVAADAKSSSMRSAKESMKTVKLRGRG